MFVCVVFLYVVHKMYVHTYSLESKKSNHESESIDIFVSLVAHDQYASRHHIMTATSRTKRCIPFRHGHHSLLLSTCLSLFLLLGNASVMAKDSGAAVLLFTCAHVTRLARLLFVIDSYHYYYHILHRFTDTIRHVRFGY